ncbi:MAG TPA: formate dehydrogenase accessory sulfurtransferase FdhD [Magnetospirillaceae bacterium]|jgi:FdhD protein
MPRSDATTLSIARADDRPIRDVAETVKAYRVRGARTAPIDAAVAAEVPIALAYNGTSHVVMMATPADLADFALGFSLSEGILADTGELHEIAVEDGEDGVEIALDVAPHANDRLSDRRRNMTGRTGCGLCGVDELVQVARPLGRVGVGQRIEIGAVHKALDALRDHQAINQKTGAVHAAAWAGIDGAIILVREDVGRHNALDKLIGAMARAGIDFQSGFAVITSRCSFEMVQKAVTVNIPFLVAISAPTTMALRIAERAGLTLVALARSDSVTAYANPGRIAGLEKTDAS